MSRFHASGMDARKMDIGHAAFIGVKYGEG